MSGTGSLMIRNLRKPNDYEKAKMTQDELLRIAIANDANVSGARKNFQAGIVEELPEKELRSPTELQADMALQEKNALDNLLKLFQYREAGQIISSLNPDDIFILNATFPQLEKDLKTRFNVTLLSPTFFYEYFMKYKEELEASKGVSTNLSSITNKFNDLTDNINDLRQILPTVNDFNELSGLLDRAFREIPNYVTRPVLDRIDALQRGLPSRADLIRLEGQSEVDKYEILAELQNATSNLPTHEQLQMIIEDIRSGRMSQQDGFQQLQDAISGVSDAQLEALQDIQNAIAESTTKTGSKGGIEIIAQINTPVTDLTTIVVAKRIDSGTPIGRELIFRILRDGTNLEVTGKFLEEQWRGNQIFNRWWRTNIGAVNQNKPAISDLKAFIKANNTGGGKASATVVSEATTGSGLLQKAKNGRIKVQKVGKGVAYEPEPQYRQFGKYVINIPQLKERDILNVKFPSLGRIPQFKPTPISDVFKEFLIDLLETGKTSNRIYDQIPIEERQLFERIATGAGLIHSLKIKKTITDDDKVDTERFAILKGEYLAGNNSVALMKELRKMVVKFMGQGKISKTDGLNLLVELSV